MNEQALKDRIHNIAKEKGIRFNECWKQLLLARFLARLSHSNLTDKFIFKGGYLLTFILDLGRETTDLDFLVRKLSISENEISIYIIKIAAINLKDGFIFSYDSIEPLDQPHMKYSGFRINLNVEFNRMRDVVVIDIGVGDIVQPEEKLLPMIEYKGKPLFENEISLLVYPPETIFAEKFETTISKGSSNSRMKDYHDLLLLSRSRELFQIDALSKAIKDTFENRETSFEFINFSSDDLKPLQIKWNSHLKALGDKSTELNIPKNIHEVIEEINSFLGQIN